MLHLSDKIEKFHFENILKYVLPVELSVLGFECDSLT